MVRNDIGPSPTQSFLDDNEPKILHTADEETGTSSIDRNATALNDQKKEKYNRKETDPKTGSKKPNKNQADYQEAGGDTAIATAKKPKLGQDITETKDEGDYRREYKEGLTADIGEGNGYEKKRRRRKRKRRTPQNDDLRYNILES